MLSKPLELLEKDYLPTDTTFQPRIFPLCTAIYIFSMLESLPGRLWTSVVAQALVLDTAVRKDRTNEYYVCLSLISVHWIAVQVNTTMFILFGYDFTLSSLADIHALDTVNWKWVTQFSASGYPLQTNNSTLPAATNSTSTSHGSSSSSLSTGAIAGIAVGGAVVVVGNISLWLSRFFLSY